MSTVAPAPVARATETEACALCGAPMQRDQEWCLECGAGRTILHGARRWALPIAAAGTVILAATAAFVIAVAHLGQVPAPVRMPVRRIAAPRETAAAVAKPKPPARRTPALTGAWPPGLSGWTVALATTDIRSVAQRDARAIAHSGVPGVGVLDTSQHPHMHVREFIVFSQRYPTDAAASAAAAKLSASGHAGAYPIEVAPPGGV
jgi:hypothetical protein